MNPGDYPILLIEDNEDHAELIKLSMKSHNLANKIIHLPDGEQALNFLFGNHEALYQGHIEMPAIILLDLRMPKVDGLQVLKRIKEHESTKHIPVVVLTTSENDNDIKTAYKYHANSYLVKPAGFQDFSMLIRELGIYWLLVNKKSP